VAIAMVSAQRNRSQKVPQPAAIATCKTGNRRTQQVTEAAICKTGIIAQKEPAGDNTDVSREDVLLEIHNTQSIIRCCSSQLRSAASAETIKTITSAVFGKNTHPDTSQISGQSV
jgi:hypothetical protein